MKARFIVFEGIDGCGKSSQAFMLSKYLKSSLNLAVTLTREPGGSETGEFIRKIFLAHNFTQQEQYILLLISRLQHIKELILPRLKAGETVISDRYSPSSFVYQNDITEQYFPNLYWLSNLVANYIKPDIIFLLDIEPKIAIKRILNRQQSSKQNKIKDIFEKKLDLDLIAKRRNLYLNLAKNSPQQYHILDANNDKQYLHQQIALKIRELYNA